jgi:hypothetical protein
MTAPPPWLPLQGCSPATSRPGARRWSIRWWL